MIYLRRCIFVVAALISLVDVARCWDPTNLLGKSKNPFDGVWSSKTEIYPGITLMTEPFRVFQAKDPRTDMQRGQNDDYVTKYYNVILGHRRGMGAAGGAPVPYLGEMSVGICGGKYHILDGQHRYRAFEMFASTTPEDFPILYKVQYFKDEQQMKKCFFELNDRYDLPQIVKDTLFTEPRTQLIEHLKTKYPSHTTSASLKPNYPNIHVDTFVPLVIGMLGGEDVVGKMEQLNSDVGKSLSKKDPKRYEQSMKKDGLFLAILMHKTSIQKKRASIPGVVRERLWQRYSPDTTTSSCACCRRRVSYFGSNEASIDHFHAGHFVSVKNGGSDDIDNLRVLCSACNLGMGSKNIDQFKAQYFPSS
jgi:5-methylcytosine-specific restriction endonuclease McrA